MGGRQKEGEWAEKKSKAQQCYLIDQFVINLLPQAVVVRFYSVKGVWVFTGKKMLVRPGIRTELSAEERRLKYSKSFHVFTLHRSNTFHW